MSKRSSSDESDNDVAEPSAKRRKYVEFEPVRICSISGVKDIDNKVLRAQHYKICERFKHKEKQRALLEKRVEELESRQAKDDEVACIINRYWNCLDEDVQLLLQRFDAEANVDFQEEKKDEKTKHFLKVLSDWSLEEMDEKLSQRVEFTQRALSKLVQVYDKLTEKNDSIVSLLSGDCKLSNHLSLSKDNENENPTENCHENSDLPKKGKENVNLEVKSFASETLNQNTKLQKMITYLQGENHRLSLLSSNFDDQIGIMENQVEQLTNDLEDARYQLEKALRRSTKLEHHLADYVKKEQSLEVDRSKPEVKVNGTMVDGEETANVSKTKLEELQQELDLQTELASNRLLEIQEITERNKTALSELETCQMKLKYIPSDVIKSSPEYLSLQSNFSAIFDDCRMLRHEIDDLRQQLNAQKQAHIKHVESLKAEEAAAQERMQETVLELDNQLNQVRKEYDTLCIEFEQSNAANEQAGPINEQVLALMNTYSTQNAQLKLDVSRYKRRWTEAADSFTKCQKELNLERKLNNEKYLIIKLEDEYDDEFRNVNNAEINAENLTPSTSNEHDESVVTEQDDVKYNVLPSNGSSNECSSNFNNFKSNDMEGELKPSMPELDSKNNSDQSTQLTAVERRLRLERDKAVEQLRVLTKQERKEKLKFYSDEAKRKIRSLEEQCEKLCKELANAKQEEDGLMAELDSTGQACDEMQEQNQKLVQQLREKDEANLKLMAERIRTNQVLKKMKEEKDTLDQAFTGLENLTAAKDLLIKKLEEKERALSENRSTLEQELRLRDQINDSLKRKAAESAQSANDMKLRLDKLSTQFSELQENVTKKAASYEVMNTKIKRLEEEKSKFKRKLDRSKRMEKFDNADELLKEENRLLKESLTCPSCKVNTKNAILTKCYHVFCFNCLKLRYDTRRRKCPKCNAAFGANDFRRVYIE